MKEHKMSQPSKQELVKRGFCCKKSWAQVCYCGEVAGEELGWLDDVLQLSGRYSANHLHDQHGRGLSSAVAESNEDQVLFPHTGGRAKATLPGHGWHHQKVDDADSELAAGAQSVGDTLWGQDRLLMSIQGFTQDLGYSLCWGLLSIIENLRC